jgi:hypothetical protein
MKQTAFVLLIAFFAAGIAAAQDAEVRVQRAANSINKGFKERIYIDGVKQLTLRNGESGAISVPPGDHTIHAELSTTKTAQIPFSVSPSKAVQITITSRSVKDLIIDIGGEVMAGKGGSSAVNSAPAKSNSRAAASGADGGVENSLLRGAEIILKKVPLKARMAIVYVTANDPDIADFIANELEFIMVDAGRTLIDRSQLDRIRQEQKFQLSGEVDDSKAVSVGKLAGADVILTGAVTGTGNLRRLRLRVLDTQTAQVIAAASERF